MLRYRTVGACAVFVALCGTAALALPEDQAVFTDFEGISSTDFVVGSSPASAHFSGGLSDFLGIFELYHSGLYAWMIDPQEFGLIEFETDAAVVEFYARNASFATQPTLIVAMDEHHEVVDSHQIDQNEAWELVTLRGVIDHIEVYNFDTEAMNSIDDFGFTPVPEPGTLALLGVVGAAVIRRARVRR